VEGRSSSFSVARPKPAAEASPVPRPAAAGGVAYGSLKQFQQRVELYRGSISTVYRATCVASGGRVILKAYHKPKMAAKHLYKLDREVAAMEALRGPHVAELIARFEDADAIYLARARAA